MSIQTGTNITVKTYVKATSKWYFIPKMIWTFYRRTLNERMRTRV